LYREYIRAISQIVGSTKDIPASNVYTNSKIMAWMLDEHDHDHLRELFPRLHYRKTLMFGGSYRRETVTSKGVVYTIQ